MKMNVILLVIDLTFYKGVSYIPKIVKAYLSNLSYNLGVPQEGVEDMGRLVFLLGVRVGIGGLLS